MKEYKRMTKQSGWKADMDLTQEMGYSWIYQRLSELENKIEQGTLKEIPENAVVLTEKKDIQQYEWSKMCDKMGIFKLVEKESAKARKETAEKFAERLKEKLNEWLEDNEDLNGKIDFGIAMIELIGVKSLDGEVIAESLIDEICEEIIGEV